MTEKELKGLSRQELLELLLLQGKQLERLQEKVAALEEKLRDRSIVQQEAGSIAEAALRLNDVFDAAQRAAEQYLESVTRQCDRKEALARQVLEQACKKADRIVAEAEAAAQRRMAGE